MKLWQKVFFSAMALLLIAINVTAGVLIGGSYRLLLEQEWERAVSEHQYFTASVKNQILAQRLRQGEILLKTEEVSALLPSILQNPGGHIQGMAVYFGDKQLQSTNADALSGELVDAVKEAKDSSCRTLIQDVNGVSYLMVGSTVKLEGIDYHFFTLSDISATFQALNRQLFFAQVAGILFALLIGSVLMLIVIRLFKPFHQVVDGLQTLADGDYTLRLPETGGEEFKLLSRNINTMAASVEENIGRVKALADNRKQFIDNLAHEMKTPLTSILGFADLLRVQKNVEEKKRQEYAGIILEETRRLQSLSGKLMELITTGNTELEMERVFVPDLFQEIIQTAGPILERSGMTLISKPADKTVLIDRALFKSLLYNLIDNGMKASSKGDKVCLFYRDTEEEFSVGVADQGIGMSKETIEKAAEPFYMADKSRTRKAGGAGLGLALCAEIARRHGASLNIQSELHKGSIVSVVWKKGESSDESQS